MKISKSSIAVVALFALAFFAATAANAQFGGMLDKAKTKAKDKTKTADGKPGAPTETKNAGGSPAAQSNSGAEDETEARAESAKKLAKAAGMPKAANTDAALNKLLFQAADDVRLIPRKVVVVDKDWFTTTGAHNKKVRRIFAVLGRTTDDGCGKLMVQFDQNWNEDKNAWDKLIYVQNIGEVTPIACGAIGK